MMGGAFKTLAPRRSRQQRTWNDITREEFEQQTRKFCGLAPVHHVSSVGDLRARDAAKAATRASSSGGCQPRRTSGDVENRARDATRERLPVHRTRGGGLKNGSEKSEYPIWLL